MASKSNWYVVTGGPSSGLDTTLDLIKKRGYPVVNEVARGVIKKKIRQGKTAEEVKEERRRDEAEFQLSLLPIKAELEKRLPREKIIFWNRAMPDSVAYLRNYGGNPEEALKLCERGLYKRVYLLDQLPQFTQDYARIEDLEEAKRINQLLYQAYSELGYEVIRVSVMPPEERVKFILAQMSDFRIGLFTSAWDKVAWDLVRGVSQNFSVAYVFVSQEEGETRYGDLMINNVREAGLPLITFSSLRFKPEMRKKDREAWRLEHDREVMKLLPPVDLIVLVGYMWWFSEEMCQKKTAINLHPALPTGPKGTYREVIWELIKERATETGVMMHLVTPELDRGPAIAFCRFSIRGEGFDPLWQEMEKRLETESLDEIIEKEGENNPLFAAIRQKGVIRELPMVIEAIRALIEGKAKLEGGGYDLTKEIDAVVKEKT